MKYSEKIEAYMDGSMSSVEQMVFQQELTENADLKAAYDAHLLMEELLGFTASNLSETQILSSSATQPAVSTSSISYRPPFAALLLVGLFGLFAWQFFPSTNTPAIKEVTKPVLKEEITPIKQAPLAVPTVQPVKKIATPVVPKAELKASEIFIDPAKDITPAPIPVPVPNRIATKQVEQPKSIAANTIVPEVELLPILQPKEISLTVSSDELIASGTSKIFTAKESITLGPGFIVEAGASFQAVID